MDNSAPRQNTKGDIVTRRLLVLLFTAFCAACVSGPSPDSPQATVNRAIAALGGDSLRSVRSLEATGASKHWEPEQSHIAGGEPRFAADSTFTLARDFGANAARIDWQRKLAYPAPREYRFTETFADGIGFVRGVDSTGRVKQSLDANPPAHTMSRFRVTAMARELQRSAPLLALDMQANAAQLEARPDTNVGGQTLKTVAYPAGGRNFLVMFDPATNLPVRIRTLDYDSVQGDSTYDLVLSDWRDVAGAKIAHRHVYQLNGRTVIDTQLSNVKVNPAAVAGQFDIPAEFRKVAAMPQMSIPYQWVIRRQFIGTYLDSDAIAWDPASSAGLRLQEVAPGVQLTQGGSHNSLIVEMRDHLIVFDAPVSDAYSQWVLDQAKAKYPGKPVRTLVLTHHHMDHASGTRAYAAQGATVVVGAGNGAHFRQMLTGMHTMSPDLKATVAAPRVTEVSDRLVLSDGKRNVNVYLLDNPHAAGMVIGFIDDARVGFVTDIWSPGRDPIGKQLNPGQAAVVAAVKKAGIAPEQFAGGHGSTGKYADLAALDGK
jgi:glyoxylase-like metal-dependent hydrolase (beta-lactamase superfamily II)